MNTIKKAKTSVGVSSTQYYYFTIDKPPQLFDLFVLLYVLTFPDKNTLILLC